MNQPLSSVAQFIRHFVQTTGLIALVLIGNVALAFSGQATDDAFAALLSMPGSGPENNNWEIPVPKDFVSETESGLIAYLAKKQKAGADFNAYRHFGTLLQHAIRDGRIRTAIWLLDHGADPRKTVSGGTADALALSVTYKRAGLIKLLRDKYGLIPEPAPAAHLPAPEPDVDKLVTAFRIPEDILVVRILLERTAWAAPMSGQAPAVALLRQWNALKARMPADFMAKLVDDEQAMVNLIRQYSGRPATDLDKVLAALPPDLVMRHAKTIVGAVVKMSNVSVSSGASRKITYSMQAESWRAVWRHVGRPIDYSPWPYLAERLPPELWPELFASGYDNRHSETALQCLLTDTSANDLKALWPRLQTHFPDISQAAPRMVLAQYRLGGYCSGSEVNETRNKLLFLSANGIKEPVYGLVDHDLKGLPKDLLDAMRPFLPTTQSGTTKARLVDAKPGCRFELTDLWYKDLFQNPVVGSDLEPYERVSIDSVQLLEIPGESECALLVGGSSRLESYVGGIVETFFGIEENPTPSCPDPTDRYEIRQHTNGKIHRIKTDMGGNDGNASLSYVRDTKTGHHYYLQFMEPNRCRSVRQLPNSFEWVRSGSNWALTTNYPADIENALVKQCHAEDFVIRCDAIDSMAIEYVAQPRPPVREDAFKGMSFQTMLRTFRASQFDEYQAAILALDKEKLKSLQELGVPGEWTAEALTRIGTSKLSLADKRKRTAWIFIDRKQLSRSLHGEALRGLLNWLPREDWGPILNVISTGGSPGLDYLRDEAGKKGLSKLACDFARAQGLICSEAKSPR
jgi:hypothetical protein